MQWSIFLLAAAVNLPVGYIALRKRSLSVPDGVITAGMVGYTLFLLHPLYWLLLVAFFGSSTLLTKFRQDEEVKQEALSLAEKGGERDMWQVLANAGVPTVLALLSLVFQQPSVTDLTAALPVMVAVCFAVVNADTWATELGVTSRSSPRWVLNPLRTVPRGTSGGVSPRGLVASLAASSLVAAVYGGGLLLLDQYTLRPLLLICLGGMLGSLADSVLGATLQVQYHCAACDKLTEQVKHARCGTVTVHQRGLAWIGNDLVNVASVLLALLLVAPLLG